MSKANDNTTVISLRVPLDLSGRIEEFCNESNLERPTQAIRALIEVGLQMHEQGKIDVARLSTLQANATGEALAVMYEALSEVVERVTRR